MNDSTTPALSSSSWKADLSLILVFSLLFLTIPLAMGIVLALTATPESSALIFPIEPPNGTITLTRAFCDLPK